MPIEEKEFQTAYKMWSDFSNEVLYKNRFFINHEVLDIIKSFSARSAEKINADQILYRARLFNVDEALSSYANKQKDDSNNDSSFRGYDVEGSFVSKNNDNVSDGRANPAYIIYLYTAEDAYTALVEVRPYLNSLVSVARIQVNESLQIVDFTYNGLDKTDGVENYLFYLIMKDFSKPSNANKKDYISTQYVAEFIKSLGFDGIRFNSSLHRRGRNVTIFHYDKCEAVDSKLYQIRDICFEAKAVAPEQEGDLVHYKLLPYKEKNQKEMLKFLFETFQEDKNSPT